VHVPYCTQDLHSGTVTRPGAEQWGLYFSGHLVYKAVLDALDARAGLAGATEIILTGASAGGIGTWINLDYTAARYPRARVVGAPIAGFYFYVYPYTGPNHTSSELSDFSEGAWPHHVALWQSYANEACVAAQGAARCMLSNASFPFVASATFATEAGTDQVVLLDHDWLPDQYRDLPPEREYMAEWHANMTVALSPLLDTADSRHGAFNPACFIHTTFAHDAPTIGGVSYQTALGNWFFNRTSPAGYKLADSCGIECNPTCPPSQG